MDNIVRGKKKVLRTRAHREEIRKRLIERLNRADRGEVRMLFRSPAGDVSSSSAIAIPEFDHPEPAAGPSKLRSVGTPRPSECRLPITRTVPNITNKSTTIVEQKPGSQSDSTLQMVAKRKIMSNLRDAERKLEKKSRTELESGESSAIPLDRFSDATCSESSTLVDSSSHIFTESRGSSSTTLRSECGSASDTQSISSLFDYWMSIVHSSDEDCGNRSYEGYVSDSATITKNKYKKHK